MVCDERSRHDILDGVPFARKGLPHLMNRDERSEIMPKDEACRRTGLTARRLNKAAKNGEIPALIIDGEVLILREPFERMLRGRAVASAAGEGDLRVRQSGGGPQSERT